MKNLIAIILLLSLSSTQAQNVSDYKYVILPKSFSDFEDNQYGLNNRVKYNLEQKKYIVLSADQTTWSEEVKNNPCLATTINVNKKKSMLTNKLEVVFTSCNQNNVGTFEGVSRIKEFDKGFQEAVKLAFNTVGIQNAKPSNEIANTTPKTVETIKQQEIKQEIPSNTYTSNGVKYQVATTGNNSFLLINQDNNKVVANFYPSSLPNVYHVEVISDKGNYETIGYSKDNSIIIETKNGDKSWVTTTYTK